MSKTVAVFPQAREAPRPRCGKLSAGGTACRESDILIVAFALMRDSCAVSVTAKIGESLSPRLWRGRGLIL
jgi:hypothetical protein